MLVLACSITASRHRRIRETVLLKVLGATRARVASIQLVEFGSIALLAGGAGSLAAGLLTSLMLERFFEIEFQFQWTAAVVTTLLAAGLVVVTGWIASLSVLNSKPMQVLRQE